jgi:hypothetical protein
MYSGKNNECEPIKLLITYAKYFEKHFLMDLLLEIFHP